MIFWLGQILKQISSNGMLNLLNCVLVLNFKSKNGPTIIRISFNQFLKMDGNVLVNNIQRRRTIWIKNPWWYFYLHIYKIDIKCIFSWCCFLSFSHSVTWMFVRDRLCFINVCYVISHIEFHSGILLQSNIHIGVCIVPYFKDFFHYFSSAQNAAIQHTHR